MNNSIPENKKDQTTHPGIDRRGYPPDDNWEQFELHFDQVHENFLKRLREKIPCTHPQRLEAVRLPAHEPHHKEIPLMNISVRRGDQPLPASGKSWNSIRIPTWWSLLWGLMRGQGFSVSVYQYWCPSLIHRYTPLIHSSLIRRLPPSLIHRYTAH